MKKWGFYLPVVILICVSLLSLFHTLYIKNLNENLSKSLKDAYNAAQKGDYEKTRQYSKAFMNELDKAEPLLQTTIRHDELDSIKWSAERMLEYISPDSIEDYLAENSALQKMVEHLYKNEQVIFQNLL